MAVSTPTRALASAALLVAGAAAHAQTDAPIAMYRGGPTHTGVYDGATPLAYAGIRWRFATNGSIFSSPTVAGTLVYIGSSDGHLYAIDRATGTARWTYDAKSPVSATAAVAHGMVYALANDGQAFALDAATGARRWTLRTGPTLPFPWGRESGDFYASSPTVVGDVVLFGAGDGHLYAVDAARGTIRWRLATQGRIRTAPAASDGVVFVGSADGTLYAADLATGALRWRFDTEGHRLDSGAFGFDRRTIQSSPAVSGDYVVFGSRDGSVYALDRKTGSQRWRAESYYHASWVNTSPAIADGLVFVGTSDGRFFHALDLATGVERWRVSLPGVAWSSAAVVGDAVIFGEGTGILVVVDRATGKLRWRRRIGTGQGGGGIFGAATVADGVVYAADRGTGSLYALASAATPLQRAVFWDTAYAGGAGLSSHAEVRDYLHGIGYATLDASALAPFLEARIADRAPSVVVFAIDALPPGVASGDARSLFRRYLDAGGKIVWLGLPPLLWPADSSGRRDYAAIDRDATRRLLGVAHARGNLDPHSTVPTPSGRRWGVDEWWIADFPADAADVTDVLAYDDDGNAAAWRKSYGGPPGPGFVRLLGRMRGVTLAPRDLARIAFVAEFIGVGGAAR
jgi:outer membrane protein assembly factor BamB